MIAPKRAEASIAALTDDPLFAVQLLGGLSGLRCSRKTDPAQVPRVADASAQALIHGKDGTTRAASRTDGIGGSVGAAPNAAVPRVALPVTPHS